MRRVWKWVGWLSVASCLAGSMWGQSDDAQRSEERLLQNIRQVTFEGRRAGEGYFSSDGRKLVFQSERQGENPFFQIYLMDLETGDTKRISTGVGKTTCSWVHPEGDRVLFASTHHDPESLDKQRAELEFRESGQERRYSWDYDPEYELYEKDLLSEELRRLTEAPGYDAEGSYSPDGNWIVFASNRHAYEGELSPDEAAIFENDKSYFIDLYRMLVDGRGLERLTDAPGYDGGPFFSWDGRKICWRRFSEDGLTAEIYVAESDGSNPRKITDLGAMSWAPFFHPSGEYLVFATNLHGFSNFELYLVDAEGQSDPVRVTHTDGFDGLASFSPNGRLLTWTSNRTGSGRSQIFFADWDHQRALELLELSQVRRPTDPEISEADVRMYVEELASDEMEGRLTGQEGARRAGSYVASVLRAIGLDPAGSDGDYFQPFEFTSGVSLGEENRLRVQIADEIRSPEIDREWRPVAFSKTGSFEPAEVVFAGYGIVAPEEEEQAEYDSYVHLDVEGKWVLALRYLPEDVSAERRQHLARYSGLRYKAMAARERGAIGMMVVSGPTSRVEDELVDLSFDASLGTTSLGFLSLSDEVAGAMLESADKSLESLQEQLDQGEPVMGFSLPEVKVESTVDIVHEKDWGRNVLARLQGSDPAEPALVVGAHLDHLGRGRGMSTLAREDEVNQIHYGADDNASGVAAVLEMAHYLFTLESRGEFSPVRDIVFAFWSGEELGLLGSSHFTQQLAAEVDGETIRDRVAAYLNLDMVGRYRENLILQGVGSSEIWPTEIERRNVPVGLSITTQNDSYLPTDSTSFYLKGVPVLSAFTGTHREYHSPRDRPETLNYEGNQKVAFLMAMIARSLAADSEEPDYQKMTRPDEGRGRANLRAYLGTIPDYAQGDATGVALSGVIGGGPAEEAGLKSGDVIVELAGRRIENIYDYTYAIEALKIGETVSIVVERNGEEISLEITPASRD